MIRILNLGYCFFLILIGVPSLFLTVSSATVNFFEIIGLFVILPATFFWAFLSCKIPITVAKTVLFPFLALIIVLLCDVFSFLGLIFNFESYAASQFFKAIIYRTFFFSILTFYILYSIVTKFVYAEQHLRILVLVIVASCLYQFVSIGIFLASGESLDEAIWPLLTVGSWEPWDQDMRLGGEEIPFVFIRHGGFAGNPNILALQIFLVLPVVVFMRVFEKRYVTTSIACICIVSLLLTMSRSALVGMGAVAAVLIYRALFKFHFDLKLVARSVVLIALLGYSGVFLFGVDALTGFYDLFTYRLNDFSYWDTPRGQLTSVGLDIYSDSPIFGTGAGTSPVWLSKFSISEVTGPSLHNFWLQKMVELGIFALGHVLVFLLFFYHASRGGFGLPLALSVTPVAVVGLSNNALSHPFVLAFFTVFAMYVCSVRSKGRRDATYLDAETYSRLGVNNA